VRLRTRDPETVAHIRVVRAAADAGRCTGDPKRKRCNMNCNISTTRPIHMTMVCLTGAVAAAITLASPVMARGGGHHHGECGEHHGSYECHNWYEGHHHRDDRRPYFENYHRRYRYDLGPADDQSGYDDPAPLRAPPSTDRR